MRIVFFGTPLFAVRSLEALLGAGAHVVAVVTQPDQPQGRSRSTLIAPPVKQVADRHRIPVLPPDPPAPAPGPPAPDADPPAVKAGGRSPPDPGAPARPARRRRLPRRAAPRPARPGRRAALRAHPQAGGAG